MFSFYKHFPHWVVIFVNSEKKIRKLLKKSSRLIPDSCVIIKLYLNDTFLGFVRFYHVTKQKISCSYKNKD